MPIADVELTISRKAGAATASLRVELPSHRVEPVRGVPIDLDDAALAALALHPDDYGVALTAMVFPPPLREAWREARAYADGRGEALRLRLALDGDDTLHALRWELLRDPVDGAPLAHSERVRLSRSLPTASYRPLHLPARPELRVVVAVASPPWLPAGLDAVDIAGEVARARQGLGDVPTQVLDGRDGRPAAALPQLAAALRDGAHVLYIVCHGALVEGEPVLYLEREGGERYTPVAGAELVQALDRLEQPPLLVVLASCQGAGDTHQVLAAVGPQLARGGVGAVLAMQGNVPVELVARLMPTLFAELRRDGQIDRALAAARAALPDDAPWWMPALWMAVRDGALWVDDDEPPFVSVAGLYPPCPRRVGQNAVAADLAARLRAAANDRAGAVLLLESPPGYGKYAIVRELAASCVAMGGVVLAADLNFAPDAEDQESPASVAAPAGLAEQLAAAWRSGASAGAHWLQLMAQAQVALGRTLTPARMGVDDDPGALITALAQMTYSRPTLLVIEHWERAGTAWDVLLGELVDTLTRDPLRLLVVLTRDKAWSDTAPKATALEHSLAQGTVVRHELRRASADDLAAAVGPAHLDLVERLHELSGGHPALALALWNEWQGVGAVRKDSHGVFQATDDDSPWVARSVREIADRLLRRRLGDSPALPLADMRRALAVAALEGPVFTVPAVADVAGLELDTLLDIFDALLDDDPDARVLFEAGPVAQPEELTHIRLDRYGFALPYLQFVFAQELRGPERAEAALALAEAIERRYQPRPERAAGALAGLFALGGDTARAEAYRARDERDRREQAGEEALRWSIAALERQGMGQTSRMYEARLDLAIWLHERVRYTEALPEALAALQIAEGLADQLRIALACSWIGHLLQAQGDLAAARPYFERALAIREQALGPSHPDTAQSLNNLGYLLQAQGDLAAARPYFERALTILTARLGLQHPRTQHVQRNLAALDAPQETRE